MLEAIRNAFIFIFALFTFWHAPCHSQGIYIYVLKIKYLYFIITDIKYGVYNSAVQVDSYIKGFALHVCVRYTNSTTKTAHT